MTVSSGNLNALLNLTIDAGELTGLTVDSNSTSGSGASEIVSALEATATGTQDLTSGYSLVVTGVLNSANLINTEVYDNGVDTNQNVAYYVLGFSADSLLLSTFNASFIANYLDLDRNVDPSLTSFSFIPPTSGSTFDYSPNGTFTQTACYARGTHILTTRGGVAVEDLRAGDLLVTPRTQGVAPVKWVGHRRLRVAGHPRPWDVAPVRVCAGAFGPGRPARDLVLSPDHAIYIAGEAGVAVGTGGMLVPIRYLINGATIVQEMVETITYFHVELPDHDVIVAEGLPAESYLDTGNRAAFANGGGATLLHPDFARKVWTESACAPLAVDAATLLPTRRALHDRALALGYATTTEPLMRVRIDGQIHEPTADGTVYRFDLPAGVGEVVLVSRAAAPAHVDCGSDDTRRLGLAVAGLRCDGRPLPLSGTRFGAGWHDTEYRAGTARPVWRWTDGEAVLQVAGARMLEIELAMTTPYWLSPEYRAAKAG